MHYIVNRGGNHSKKLLYIFFTSASNVVAGADCRKYKYSVEMRESTILPVESINTNTGCQYTVRISRDSKILTSVEMRELTEVRLCTPSHIKRKNCIVQDVSNRETE